MSENKQRPSSVKHASKMMVRKITELLELGELRKDIEERLDSDKKPCEVEVQLRSEIIALRKQLAEAVKRNAVLTEALDWIMPKVHQGNHDGEFGECPKATCMEYRKAMSGEPTKASEGGE